MQIEVHDYKDIGDYLRDIRENAGLDIRVVAHQLNIRAKYLLALENGALSEIPGKVYARGYLQNYAEFLGLDKEEIAEAFDRLVSNTKEVKYFVPEPTSRGYQPGMLLLGITLFALVAIYSYWHSTLKETISPPAYEMVSPVPERLLNPLAEPELQAEPGENAEPSEGAPELPAEENAGEVVPDAPVPESETTPPEAVPPAASASPIAEHSAAAPPAATAPKKITGPRRELEKLPWLQKEQ